MLNPEDVLWIKELYFGDARSATELAKMFRVSIGVILPLLRGKTYQWVKALV